MASTHHLEKLIIMLLTMQTTGGQGCPCIYNECKPCCAILIPGFTDSDAAPCSSPQVPGASAGPPGPPGDQGPKGDTGAAGAQGPQGLTGAAGAQGAKGDTGQTGVQGAKGDTGETGGQGPKGDTGETGAQGPMGMVGPAGMQGPRGDTGASGSNGAKGDTGETGSRGPKGEPGQPGMNPLRKRRAAIMIDPTVCCVSSNTAPGCTACCAAARVNDRVDCPEFCECNGPPGPKGSAGPVGPKGDDGKDGLMGPPGSPGKDGQDQDPADRQQVETSYRLSIANTAIAGVFLIGLVGLGYMMFSRIAAPTLPMPPQAMPLPARWFPPKQASFDGFPRYY